MKTSLRVVVVFATSVCVTGCVTTQGGVGALNNPLMAIADVFDKTGNDFRALLRDKKFSEAREFFDANSEYFSKRLADSKERVQDEVRPLLDYVYITQYERQVNASLARMSVISDVSDAGQWQQQDQALQGAFKLANAARQDKVLAFFDDYPGKAQVAALAGHVERVISIAKGQREPALESTFQRVLDQGFPAGGIRYVGHTLKPQYYQQSPKFQAALIQRLEQASEASLAEEIKRFADLMTQDTQKRVLTDIFGGRLKKQMQADGRIDLEELHRLMQAKRAFPQLDLSQFVKVGVMDLTSGTLKSRGTFDFEVDRKSVVRYQLT